MFLTDLLAVSQHYLCTIYSQQTLNDAKIMRNLAICYFKSTWSYYNKTSTNVALELEKKESWLKINIIIYCNSIGSILKNTRKLRKQFHVFQINHTHNHNNDDIIEYNIHQISYTLQFKLRLMNEYIYINLVVCCNYHIQINSPFI